MTKNINVVGLLWCIENEEKILTAEQENIKTPEVMRKTLTSEEILSTLPSSRSFEPFQCLSSFLYFRFKKKTKFCFYLLFYNIINICIYENSTQ